MQLGVITSLFFILLHRINCQTWNYEALGPDVWSDTYPVCAGHSQSPINIRTACTSYQSFPPFRFSPGYNLTYNYTLINNGHTIVGTYNGNGSTPLVLTGGGLNGAYNFLSFHLHWGENYKSGSEHQINGVKYSGEIHFVHIQPETNKIAVLGIFMQSIPIANLNQTTHKKKKRSLNKIENPTIDEWNKYFTVAENLQEENNSTIVSLNIASLIGDNLDDFWRYEGSLTTPPCTEGVIWTVFKTPITFSENELASFRKNISFEIYRPPQPLYDRVVYRNFLNTTLSSIPDYNCCSKDLGINLAISFRDQNSIFLILFSILFRL